MSVINFAFTHVSCNKVVETRTSVHGYKVLSYTPCRSYMFSGLYVFIIFTLLLSICTMVVGTAVAIENVTISSTIFPTQRVCPGEIITFTCVTRGSLITAWLSEEYIGAGGVRVEFAAVDIGESVQIDQNTLAMLISAEIINGT